MNFGRNFQISIYFHFWKFQKKKFIFFPAFHFGSRFSLSLTSRGRRKQSTKLRPPFSTHRPPFDAGPPPEASPPSPEPICGHLARRNGP
ncbi:hypothetical protein RchiOBHm_Chr3g0454901 [Rosa chinensis]|uniref:Uncharacterized protein n=1 Tax=Rosa chinensis TaxID=74649 RepID=A0A2P6R712_ROSCH|nr:hypothetical protein RchiOBHm_Chr3g0454901 [Rosa chinensis]